MTISHLNGSTLAEFIEANAEVDDWPRRQPGFRSRRIAGRDDGDIVDVQVWDSLSKQAWHRD